jgi:HD-GYP domain-containing protein (c-di-GMP phosphodiesterase class II)
MRESSGNHFDPVILNAFVSAFDRKYTA